MSNKCGNKKVKSMGRLTRGLQPAEKKERKKKKAIKTNKKNRACSIKECTEKGAKLPDQLVVDIQLEFGMKVGKTDTERGPVMRRKDREEVVNRRAVSTK